MLLITEIGRLAVQAVGYAIAQRRIGLLVLLILAGLIVMLSATVTVAGPVAIYPFL